MADKKNFEGVHGAGTSRQWEVSGEMGNFSGDGRNVKRVKFAGESSQMGLGIEAGTPALGVVSKSLIFDTPIPKTTPVDQSGRRLNTLLLSSRNLEYTPVERGGSELVMSGRRNPVPGSSRVLGEYLQRRNVYGVEDDHSRGQLGGECLDSDGMRCSYKCRHMMKSEVLEELDQKREQVASLEQELSALKEAAEKAAKTEDVERKLLVDQVQALEKSVAAGFAREKAVQAARQRDSDAAEARFKQQLARAGELQVRAQDEMRKRMDAEAAASAAEARAKATDEAGKKLAESKAWELRQARDELTRFRREAESAQFRLNTELTSEKTRASRAQGRLESLQREMEHLNQQLEKETAARHALEVERAEAEALACLPTVGGSSKEAETIIKNLRAALAHGAADVAAARQIRERHASVQVLRERMAEEQARAERAEGQLVGKAVLEQQVAALQAEIDEWTAMASSVFHVADRNGLLQGMSELQSSMLAATERQGQLEGELQGSKAAVHELEKRLAATEREAESARADAREAADGLRRAERKMDLIAKERDGLKSILASYDEEERAMACAAAKGVVIPSGTPDKSKSLRLQECESKLEEARQREAEMEDELKIARDMATNQRKAAECLQEQLEAAKSEIQSLTKAGASIEKRLELFEEQVTAGGFDPSTTKVLHMKVNPLSEALSAYADSELHREVERLRSCLRSEQTAKGSEGWGGGDLSTGSAEHGDRSQGGEGRGGGGAASLAEEVKKLKIMETRYKKVFHAKITLFREACYLLFGYKLDMTEAQDEKGILVTTFSLRSQFATDESQSLQFQYVNSKNIELLKNAYSASPEVEPMVRTFLTKFQCIPALTANLTMQLFNDCTMS